MPIDAIPVGANLRSVVIKGDNVVASQYEAVLPVDDAINTSGRSGGLSLAILELVNPKSGNKDQARAASGTLGVQSVSLEGTKNTFSCAVSSITLAVTATDFFTIFGSGTRTVRVLRVIVSGFATGAASVDMILLLRSTADSGGASTTPTSIPHDTNNTATVPTAALLLYTANPTLGTLVGNVRARKLNLGAAGSAGVIEWNFSDKNDQAIVLRGATQGLCLNFNGQAVPSGTSLDIEIEFVEDNS